ncbi:MAG: polyphosphate kinase 2 [Holophagales bacterium]|jgi:polyphosphate kinase 2|nr:polyphosphate kinase 2 [Holophagales bacterium]
MTNEFFEMDEGQPTPAEEALAPKPHGFHELVLPPSEQDACQTFPPVAASATRGDKKILRDKRGRFAKSPDLDALEKSHPPASIVIDDELVSLEELTNLWRFHKLIPSQDFDFISNVVKRRLVGLQLSQFQAELVHMQKYLIENKLKMIILFEGRDAAGKGGTIRAVTRHMNQRHYRIVALGKPTEREATQWYYQKFVSHFPSAGEIVLFDRSWYTRAMVERVFGFCSEKQYKDFMLGVTGFEKDLIRQDIILIKLYYSVTKEVQAERFNRRKTDPLRQWKLSRVDMQAQNKWNEFTQVKYDTLKQTSIPVSPWYILRSDDKYKARLNTMKLILSHVPYKKLNPDLNFVTDPEIVISGARELERLEAERLKYGLEPSDIIV